MVQNTVCAEASTSFNGAPSRRKRREFSSLEAKIVQRPFFQRNNRFSLFKWFKRRNRDSSSKVRVSKIPLDAGNSSSSSDSIDTCSTATVRSFTFQNRFQLSNQLTYNFPKQSVGPFGEGAVKLVGKNHSNATSTLPNFSNKRDIRERYSLQKNSFNSCGNIPVVKSSLKEKKVHVKGKRRAPNPPDFATRTNVEERRTGRGRRRPAPQPPENNLKTDTLILRGGVLLPVENKSESSEKVSNSDGASSVISEIKETQQSLSTLGMPRPWYKRSVFENSRNSSLEKKEEESGMSSLKLNFFHRRENSDDRRREAKRKSGISILTNISQLDKEAAAIVQEEQRAKELLQNRFILEGNIAHEELVQNMVTTMESSPLNTRALISKFNAISNLTKVSVNSNFFTKNSPTGKRRSDLNQIPDHKTDMIREREKERDLSRYFLPHQKSPKLKSDLKVEKNFTEDDHQMRKIETHDRNSFTVIEKVIQNEKNSFKRLSSKGSHYMEEPTSSSKADFSDRVPTPEKNEMSRKLETIFDEIDKELQRNNVRLKDNLKPKTQETSSQVTKILDFLVESESTKPSSKKDSPTFIIESKNLPKTSNAKDPTTDLKELLKEMKHSLPKRSKIKKTVIEPEPEIPKINEPSTSFSNQFSPNLKKDFLKSEIIQPRLQEGEKQKVSFGVQTSGNLRKIDNNLPLKQEIIFRNVEQNGVSKLTKNQFHLIRPKDFAEIEAIKLVKKSSQENIYANVIEQSLYANAMVPPKSALIHNSGSTREEQVEKRKHFSPGLGQKERLILSGNTRQDHVDEFRNKNMNTLAVNKLLKKLEAAIASGNHQQAAMLAKELAQLKIHCSMIRQRAATAKAIINVNMYIEDKDAHQGPIPLLLPTNMTVAQLKAKIYVEFEIPINIQRWIIGKNLSDNDDSTLDELQTTEGSPVFLYLVAPDLNQDDAAQTEKINIVEEVEKAKIQEANLEPEIIQVPLEDADNINSSKAAEEKEHTSKEIKLDRYEELMFLENFDVVPNSEPIECPICFATYGAKEGITLRDCLHAFCRPCIANTILYCEEAEVKCPYTDSEYTCEAKLQEREIKALVAPKVYQQHLAKSIAQAENAAGNAAFHCKTPDCFGWCIYDDNVNNFLCPVCHQNNCLTCQVIHMGKNCRQYQEELRLSKETDQESKRTAAMLAEMVDRGEALPCPTCAVVLMKKWGCDWLRCTMCKTEICWVTKGPRWGPAGKGDTSGGCKCGENGVKCHPRCNYCH